MQTAINDFQRKNFYLQRITQYHFQKESSVKDKEKNNEEEQWKTVVSNSVSYGEKQVSRRSLEWWWLTSIKQVKIQEQRGKKCTIKSSVKDKTKEKQTSSTLQKALCPVTDNKRKEKKTQKQTRSTLQKALWQTLIKQDKRIIRKEPCIKKHREKINKTRHKKKQERSIH